MVRSSTIHTHLRHAKELTHPRKFDLVTKSPVKNTQDIASYLLESPPRIPLLTAR